MSAQEDLQHLTTLANRLELEDEERDKFIGSAMKRLGHKSRDVWEDGDGEGSETGGDFFSTKRREQRPTRTSQRRSSNNDGGLFGGTYTA